MNRRWLGVVGMVALSACTSPYKVHELDDDAFEPQGDGPDGSIGISGKSEVEIKSETSAAHELAAQDLANTHLEDQLRVESAALRECNHQRTGAYEPNYVDDTLARLKGPVPSREDFGTDHNGQLKHVRKEYYLDRIKAEQAYEANLRSELARVSQAQADCLTQQPTANAEAPLPPFGT